MRFLRHRIVLLGPLVATLVGCDEVQEEASSDPPKRPPRSSTITNPDPMPPPETPDPPSDLDFFLFNSSAYGEVFYGAESISEDPSTGYLILKGKAWIRMGKAIMDGREDPNSVIHFDKAAPKVVSKKGKFEMVTLLDQRPSLGGEQ